MPENYLGIVLSELYDTKNFLYVTDVMALRPIEMVRKIDLTDSDRLLGEKEKRAVFTLCQVVDKGALAMKERLAFKTSCGFFGWDTMAVATIAEKIKDASLWLWAGTRKKREDIIDLMNWCLFMLERTEK